VRDADFNRRLGERLDALMCESCSEVPAVPANGWPWWQVIRNTIVFHVLRGFPVWATRLPDHQPRLEVHEQQG
jgi:cardiolipin synthase